MTPGDFKTQVLQATDIVELIGKSVALKRRGKDFVGLCPFHQEKTPSFNVIPAQQFFYCHGCKAGGNAIDFVIKRDRVEFIDALKTLGQAAGLEMPAYGLGKEKTSERQILVEANSAAALFFEKSLISPAGQAAREYLKSRGFDGPTAKKFQIGFAPDAWDALQRSPAVKKFSPQQLALAGLVKARDEGGYLDTFRNRIMFPIKDEAGRIVGFGGRVGPGSDHPAKYLNSPETPLFAKSRVVFGIDVARQKIVETRTVAIVEGYTDVVMAHQFGASNVVSCMGTALTEHHVAILRRFADRIVLLFDADTAGDAAVNRAVELFLTQPVEIAIAAMPAGMDPDEYLLKDGLEAFNKLLAGATDALSYKWKQLTRQFKATEGLTGQQQAVEQYLRTLAEARGSHAVDSLRWGVALARVSRMTEIPVDQLNRRFKSRASGKFIGPSPAQAAAGSEPTKETPVVSAPAGAREMAELQILGILLAEPGRWNAVQANLSLDDFEDPVRRKLAEIYWEYQRNEGEVVFNQFLADLPEQGLKQLAIETLGMTSSLPDLETTLGNALAFVEAERGRRKQKKLIAQTRDGSAGAAMEAGDVAVFRQIMENARKPDLHKIGP